MKIQVVQAALGELSHLGVEKGGRILPEKPTTLES